MDRPALPLLPLDEWEPTYLTLHRWTQVVGKVALQLAPALNHWWHVALQVTPRGLSTHPLPVSGRSLCLNFDFCAHRFEIQCSDGRSEGFALQPMPVAEFYTRTLRGLHGLGVDVRLNPVPVEVVDRTPLDQDTRHAAYEREQVQRLHAILVETNRIFQVFRGKFVGKSSPVNFYWGAFDLATSRFSGRANPEPPGDPVMSEAYSHEVVAHGFWPGGDWPLGGRVDEAVYYAYAVPSPPAFAQAQVQPGQARFDSAFGEFLLPYEAVRNSADPEATLLAFMESTYHAAARLLNWDTGSLQAGAASAKPRAPEEVFADHLELALQGRFEEDIARNYAPDCLVMTGNVTSSGHAALRALAERLEKELPSRNYRYTTTRCANDVAFLEWTAEDDHVQVDDGADTFVIRNGKIIAQTIHYTVHPRA